MSNISDKIRLEDFEEARKSFNKPQLRPPAFIMEDVFEELDQGAVEDKPLKKSGNRLKIKVGIFIIICFLLALVGLNFSWKREPEERQNSEEKLNVKNEEVHGAFGKKETGVHETSSNEQIITNVHSGDEKLTTVTKPIDQVNQKDSIINQKPLVNDSLSNKINRVKLDTEVGDTSKRPVINSIDSTDGDGGGFNLYPDENDYEGTDRIFEK